MQDNTGRYSQQYEESNHYQIFVGVLGIQKTFPEHEGKRLMWKTAQQFLSDNVKSECQWPGYDPII